MLRLKSPGFFSIASFKTLFASHHGKRFHKGLSFLPGLGVLLVLSGCAAVQVRLGMKAYLSKIPVTSMEAKLAKGAAIAPGERLPLVVAFTEPDGKVWVTEGEGHGKILWKDLTVTPTVVTAGKKGVVSLSSDPRISDGKVAHVAITVPSHPDMHSEIDIPIRYDYTYSFYISGSSGSSGLNGSDGMDGSSGSMGSIDPNNPSPGGNGSDGTNGSDGSDGGPGGDASPTQVRVALRPGPHPLLQVGVSAAGYNKLYLIDPNGGFLTVTSEGGRGGSGGKGGRGGRGGSGGSGSSSGSSGRDGLSGRDGSDGSSGRAGSITVTYDPQAKPFLNIIRLSNAGGPRPVFQEQPVGPLW
jgi:hypothetical protein